MGRKRFEIRLTMPEFYAIRNALYEQGNNDELLGKINDHIEMLHAYFDGRWKLPRGIRPDYVLWRIKKEGETDEDRE